VVPSKSRDKEQQNPSHKPDQSNVEKGGRNTAYLEVIGNKNTRMLPYSRKTGEKLLRLLVQKRKNQRQYGKEE
jgi:hypothetical protein